MFKFTSICIHMSLESLCFFYVCLCKQMGIASILCVLFFGNHSKCTLLNGKQLFDIWCSFECSSCGKHLQYAAYTLRMCQRQQQQHQAKENCEFCSWIKDTLKKKNNNKCSTFIYPDPPHCAALQFLSLWYIPQFCLFLFLAAWCCCCCSTCLLTIIQKWFSIFVWLAPDDNTVECLIYCGQLCTIVSAR